MLRVKMFLVLFLSMIGLIDLAVVFSAWDWSAANPANWSPDGRKIFLVFVALGTLMIIGLVGAEAEDARRK